VVTTEVLTNNAGSPANAAGEVLLVVGVWRSGTSLLYALLNQHPQISLMYEGELALLWPLFQWCGARQWTERWELWNRAISRHHLDVTKFSPDIRDLGAACDAAYRAVAEPKHARFRGEKFPSYHDSLPELAQLFPRAKFVLIWRSPLGICDSIARSGRTSQWNRKFGLLHRALMGCEQMILGARQLRASGVRVHELGYNQLTADAEGELRKICRFLEIEYAPAMIDLSAADRSAIYPSEHHKMVRGDRILPGNRGSEALAVKFQRKVERYLARWRRIYGEQWFDDSGNAARSEDLSREPSGLELIRDRILYRALQAYDFAVVAAFCFVPIQLWKRYRTFKAAHSTP
jgi:sulfotransferase family protein